MKIYNICSLLIMVGLLAMPALRAADDAGERVSVSFHESDKFTDACSEFGGETSKEYLDILAKHLKSSAPRLLAPGHNLEVTFTDIDLAGDFNPTNANARDIRIIRDIYIPRMKLTFRLIDETGHVVKDGERRLSDLNFMNNIGIVGRNEPLFYDKALLTDWLRRELKR